MKKLRAIKAELMMKIARFIAQNHSNSMLRSLAGALSWVNRNRYGKDALDFLDENDSIDHLDYFEQDEEHD